MALDFLRSTLGLDLQSEDFLSHATIVFGSGAPGGDAAEQDAAPVGSIYMQTSADVNNLQFWWKYRDTQNSVEDWRQGASKDYIDTAIQGVSWREPVRVIDSTTYANAAAFPVTGVIDGVTLADGDRVLFTDVTLATSENVFVWNDTTNTWSEDPNSESDGDAVFIKEGTRAEQQWIYDGTNWVQIASATGAAELAFIRSFIGKDNSGAENPSYTSVTNITQGSSLEAAVGVLDGAIGDRQYTNNTFVTDGESVTASINALASELGSMNTLSNNVVTDGNTVTEMFEDIDSTFGDGDITNVAASFPLTDDMVWGGGTLTTTDALNALNNTISNRIYSNDYVVADGQTLTASINALDSSVGTGQYTNTAGHILNQDGVWLDSVNGDTVSASLEKLNVGIGSRQFTESNVVTGGQTVTASINAIDMQLGNNTFTESNFISSSNDVTQNLNAIDIALDDVADQNLVIKTANISALTAVDSIPVGTAEAAKWFVVAENRADATNRVAMEVYAVNDGTSVDYTRYAIVRRGANINGLDVAVDINAGSMRVTVSSIQPVDVVVKRVGFFTVN